MDFILHAFVKKEINNEIKYEVENVINKSRIILKIKMIKKQSKKYDIKSMESDDLKLFLKEQGYPSYRADQIFHWLHCRLAISTNEMSNLPKNIKDFIDGECELTALKPVKIQKSAIDGTKKYLFELADLNRIESVLMYYKHGNSVCISSQVGCNMGCAFCASAIGGAKRSLTAAEMLDQVYRIQNLEKIRIDNVVIMGSGEPLQNTDNLIKFLRIINDKSGLGISLRAVTVSTCGIVPEIYRLAKYKLPITLAVSLHAPSDDIRKKIMPISLKYDINTLMRACKDYFKSTGRRITFEYALMKGVNDSIDCAKELSVLLKGMNCHVNLINVNPVKERGFRQTNENFVSLFRKELEKNTINVTIRRELGQDIDGACGQLRRRYP